MKCQERFESENSEYYRSNMCQGCGDGLKGSKMGIGNEMIKQIIAKGGYKSSPPESGNNRCGKKKYT